ncbi:MAG: phage tail sheath family protein [Hyphomicrobiales bacterium]|nr:phage tail sheath family protein [Hyphomicrobiales bacterium]
MPTRRLTTMIEQSIDHGTRWVVFEPNDEPLWWSLRRDIGAFLDSLWRDGALAGASASQAYFIKCDAETMTQADIDSGRVVAEVGLVPLKPAEFIVIRVTQSIGQG